VLRIILVSLDKRLHKTIILDEPFSGAEDERIPKIAEFISTMSKRLNIQIVMVTQSELFESGADKVITI
jgi:ABC-type transporter Mla maintaining outer membrane lipid asymmetry ATPase subunit MlaF